VYFSRSERAYFAGSTGRAGMPNTALRHPWDAWLLVAATAVALAVTISLPPIPQDSAYHTFADRTGLFAIPNFWNVASNIPFVLVGAFGLRALPSLRPGLNLSSYLVFCIGVCLVGAGSAWYHYAPNNHTLVWDRLPMTIAFMGLFSMVIEDRISTRLGRVLLWPLVVAGVVAVLYWDWTELQGRGDLRPYGLVQFLPMLLMPLMLISGKGGRLRARWLWATLGTYVLAKLAEHFDGAIYAINGLVSGHSIKHLLGALAVLWAIRAMHEPRMSAETLG
ncbi:MAG: ceramidase domain-containing protein, partial [Gammaproteobacteria bacterium]